LVRTCTALAYSEAMSLRLPRSAAHSAEQLWIEWTRQRGTNALARVLPAVYAGGVPTFCCARNAHIRASARPLGESAYLLLARGEPQGAAAGRLSKPSLIWTAGVAGPSEGLLDGQTVAVRDPHNRKSTTVAMRRFPARLILATLLSKCGVHGGDAPASDPRSLAAVAFDIPLLLALFLLMAVRAELVQTPVSPLRLNAKRSRSATPAARAHRGLMPGVRLRCGLPHRRRRASPAAAALPSRTRSHRQAPNTVYWRGPHWRGTCGSAASAAVPSSCGCRLSATAEETAPGDPEAPAERQACTRFSTNS